MVAHTRAPSGPDRLRPVETSTRADPADCSPSLLAKRGIGGEVDRPTVGEGESFERSTKSSSTSIHPPVEPRTSSIPEKGRLRALNLPRALHVEETAGNPTCVQTSAGPVEIESIRERWRIDDEWWRRPISRMYYQILLTSGDQLTIFKDLETGQWFQQQY
jgi:hypothetical protein